ncbi:hypothetical protein AQUCO_00900666v1 [Aquilegia coerulea]|uniref:RING-type domain-containing protein n=1 Tax=Aquilegia coerulea TaxID=218851 RepID=A0A2G5EEU8_AQUCA|nr:hypothetical protein AQUCO_00900666v1 [Aquilegia coerulea]
MNNTIDPSGMISERINGIGYFVGISIGILLLVTTIALASFFCNRAFTSPIQPRQRSSVFLNNPSIGIEIGLDETTIRSYPTVLYSQATLDNKNTTSCCSICLSDYKNTDMLRLLPDCGHLFHVKCVDPWLRLHPTCPVCRNTPTPTPMSTPLAEVVPLAHQQV